MPGLELTRRGVLGLLGAGALMPRQLLAGSEWVLSNATVVLPDGSTLSGAGIRVVGDTIAEVGRGGSRLQ